MIPIAIKLFLGGALKRLLSGLTALWGLIRHHPKEAAIIALLALSAWQYRGKRAAFTERDAARAQTAQVITAGEQAQANQIALNKAAEAKSAAIAKETDDEHEKQLAIANDRTDSFIRANRVRPHGGSGASKTGASAESPVAQGGDGQGLPPELVAVPAADVRICTANTLRLEAVRDWGIALREAGLGE